MNLPGKSLATRKLLTFGITTFLIAAPVTIARAQKVESMDRDHGQVMLSRIKDNLKKNYYDASFHGMDVEARFKTASDKIKDAQSVGQIMGIIAQVLIELDDSHTFFMPPSRAVETDYGWTMMMIGDRCYVSSVDKGSDAEAKGVKAGDEVLQAGGHQIDRSNLWKFQYLFNLLRPQPGIRVTLRSPQGEPRQLDLMAKQKQGKKVVDLSNQNEYLELVRRGWRAAELDRDRFGSFGDQLLIWKMNEFDLTDSQIDDAFSRAKKYKALILDLRGNGGGWVTTITRIVSNVFDHDIKIGDDKSRKQSKPLIAKSRGEKAFNGKLTILVDSRSASASEILARTIQLEKRGNIIGDQTAGAVMAARHYPDEIGLEFAIFYSVSITVSDLIMSDGNSLEHRGVTPDEIRLPSAEDLAAGKDVVLSYAASLAGVTLDPIEAGKLFPIVVKIKP
jgi:C-terminal processing protease CtpA/Prc